MKVVSEYEKERCKSGRECVLHCVTITRTSEAEESAGAIPEAQVCPNHNKGRRKRSPTSGLEVYSTHILQALRAFRVSGKVEIRVSGHKFITVYKIMTSRVYRLRTPIPVPVPCPGIWIMGLAIGVDV